MVVAPNHLVVPVLADPIPDLGCFRPKRLMTGMLVLAILVQPVVVPLVMMAASRNPVVVAHPRQVNCSSLHLLAVTPGLLPRDLRVVAASFGRPTHRLVAEEHFEHSRCYLLVAQHSERPSWQPVVAGQDFEHPIRQPVVGPGFEHSTHQLAAGSGFEHPIRQPAVGPGFERPSRPAAGLPTDYRLEPPFLAGSMLLAFPAAANRLSRSVKYSLRSSSIFRYYDR
jgi:hypothetical protein